MLYLLIKLIDNALCPLEVQVTHFGWSIDICQLNTDLANQQPVILIGPVNSWTVHIIHLFRKDRDGRLIILGDRFIRQVLHTCHSFSTENHAI